MMGRACAAAMASQTSRQKRTEGTPSEMPISTLGLICSTAAGRSAHAGPSWQYGRA